MSATPKKEEYSWLANARLNKQKKKNSKAKSQKKQSEHRTQVKLLTQQRARQFFLQYKTKIPPGKWLDAKNGTWGPTSLCHYFPDHDPELVFNTYKQAVFRHGKKVWECNGEQVHFFRANRHQNKAGGIWIAFGSQIPNCGVNDQLQADVLHSSSLSAGTMVMVKWENGNWFHAVITVANSNGTFNVHYYKEQTFERNVSRNKILTLPEFASRFGIPRASSSSSDQSLQAETSVGSATIPVRDSAAKAASDRHSSSSGQSPTSFAGLPVAAVNAPSSQGGTSVDSMTIPVSNCLKPAI